MDNDKTKAALLVADLPMFNGNLPYTAEEADHVMQQFLDIFEAHGMPEIHGMFNGLALSKDPTLRKVVQKWIDAGNHLANHTFSHQFLAKISFDEFIDEFEKNDPYIREFEPSDKYWFQFCGAKDGRTKKEKDAVRTYIESKGYDILHPAVILYEDKSMTSSFRKCRDRNDWEAIDILRELFLDLTQRKVRFYKELTRSLFHRNVNLLIIMHITPFDAHLLNDFLLTLEKEDIQFVSVDEAVADEFYRDSLPSIPIGGVESVMRTYAREHGRTELLKSEPRIDGCLEDLFKKIPALASNDVFKELKAIHSPSTLGRVSNILRTYFPHVDFAILRDLHAAIRHCHWR